MNGHIWDIRWVFPTSPYLIDRTNTIRLATTDPTEHAIFLSTKLSGNLLRRVLTHELGHATMISYGLIPSIRRFVDRSYWIEAEEWICNFIADYGAEVLSIANRILSNSKGDDYNN